MSLSAAGLSAIWKRSNWSSDVAGDRSRHRILLSKPGGERRRFKPTASHLAGKGHLRIDLQRGIRSEGLPIIDGAGRSDVLFRDRRLLRLAPGHDGASQRRDRPEGTFWFGMVGMVASQFHNVPRRGVGDTILHPP